jgi:hypothetical protein
LDELQLLNDAKVKLKHLPKYSKEDLRDFGLALGPAKEIHDALAKY